MTTPIATVQTAMAGEYNDLLVSAPAAVGSVDAATTKSLTRWRPLPRGPGQGGTAVPGTAMSTSTPG